MYVALIKQDVFSLGAMAPTAPPPPPASYAYDLSSVQFQGVHTSLWIPEKMTLHVNDMVPRCLE